MKNRRFSKIYRATAAVLVMMMVFTMSFFAAGTPVQAEGGVTIGQATNGEGGKLRGCKAGDQSGGEVSLSSWSYGKSSGSAFHWKYVFRAKDPSIGKALAENMKAAAANDHIGYDQDSPDRYSFYDAAAAADWDISAISTNCETTCASAVSVCLNAAGVKVPKLWYSGIVARDLENTGQFYCYTSSDYTASPAKLLPGDILVTPDKHTAMVVESPNHFQFEVTYKESGAEEETSVLAEEGSEIHLVLNNGEEVKTIVIEDEVNLAEYTPEKGDFKFTGWKKTTDDVFSAEFEGGGSAIKTTNGIEKIEG